MYAPFAPHAFATSASEGAGVSHRAPPNPGAHSHSAVMSLHVPPFRHAHVLHPWPVNPPLHRQSASPATGSNTQRPRVGGHVPAAHVAGAHDPVAGSGANPESHAQTPVAASQVPLPPHVIDSGAPNGAFSASGPEPGQGASQSAPHHPSRHEQTRAPAADSATRPVQNCIVSPVIRSRAARAIPHAHSPRGNTASSLISHPTPAYPGLQ